MTSTNPTRPAVIKAGIYCEDCPKLYAALYYVRHYKHHKYADEDLAFGRAGTTFLNDMKDNYYVGYRAKLPHNPKDLMLEFSYNDEASFISAWNFIHIFSQNYTAYAVAIIAHHGVDAGKSVLPGWGPGGVVTLTHGQWWLE